MEKLIIVKIHNNVSYHLQHTHPFWQNYTFSWLLISIPNIFSSENSTLKFVYKLQSLWKKVSFTNSIVL